MKINADLTKRATADTTDMEWQESPAEGVWRKMLDRDGEEVARATSLVRYAPGSSFPEHTHGGGEEFFVLEGTFSDEKGDYPAGTYVRNPIDSSHSPRSDDGCVILVKLRQMSDPDEPRVVVDTNEETWQPVDDAPVERIELFESQKTGESVCLERWKPDTTFSPREWPGGAEYFVLTGSFADDFGAYAEGSWLRVPAGSTQEVSTANGCTVWIKRGHL
jgi:anti-sigma factor ChrR (cupin superfamily)